MPTRRAACDPCRRSKLACDHVKPVCGRCISKNQTASCNYRSTPFRRQRDSSALTFRETTPSRTSEESPSIHVRRYPNPGYLGHSSHTNIYAQLVPVRSELQEQSSTTVDVTSSLITKPTLRESDVLRGQVLLEEIRKDFPVHACADLIDMWLLQGSNLALAGRFVKPAIQTAKALLAQNEGSASTATLSRQLFEHSSCGLLFTRDSTFDDFAAQSCFDHARWEILGLFFVAVSMSTIDVNRFPQLYSSQSQRQALRKLALRRSDQFLSFSLALDCLNDIQVVLQYENFINHSYTNGDQSFDSWRRLGDIISSIYALGYHEQGRDRDNCPAFLKHIREAIFAFTYSADKNISIFLGRPPRMHHTYCDFTDFQIPAILENHNITQPDAFIGWTLDKSYSYMIEAWWSLVCALQKEAVLGISHEKSSDEKKRRVSLVKANLTASWLALPIRFRFAGKLISIGETPIERDFSAAARLNSLHVNFLLQLSILKDSTEMSTELLTVSQEILSLINEENIIRDQLVSSGTGLVWRTAYYGLPAAGVLCHALLNGTLRGESRKPMLNRTHQDLNVLVAYMDAGALVDVDEPNYALLVEATTTIKVVVNRVLATVPRNQDHRHDPLGESEGTMVAEDAEVWLPWPGIDTWDFEIPFWTGLAEHPNLAFPDNNPS